MKRILGGFAIVVFLLPCVAGAQEWTAEQQELWAWEVACWEAQDVDAAMACFHEDFVGWGLGTPLATNKADRWPAHARNFETSEVVYVYLKPVEIHMHGNSAVLVYLATYVERNKATGVETTYVEKWTDACLREGDRWSWIADHGTTVEEG